MTLRKFFLGRSLVFILLILIGVAAFLYMTYVSDAPERHTVEPVTQGEPTAASSFVWRFEEADSLNPDGMPETEICLDVTYTDGSVVTELVDTTHASCNALPDTDADSVPGTSNIQCYGAGLGYRFKITRGEESYLVQRKMFEEASPEYEPPVQEYETVSEIPFAQ